MGGRGTTALQGRSSTSSRAATMRASSGQQAPQAVNNNNTATFTNTVNGITNAADAASQFSQMTDDQMEQVIKATYKVDMPNHLADVSDRTQRLAYVIGLNEKPTVLDDKAFDQYLTNNNIPKSAIISRSVDGSTYRVNNIQYQLTANDITQMYKDGSLNYIGGKYGGMAYGAGTYFEQNGGGRTGYGTGATMIGIIDRSKARIIPLSTLRSAISSWSQSHPKTAAAIGPVTNRNYSVYALAMGYNVISSGKGRGTYFNVIDRSATIMRKSNLP